MSTTIYYFSGTGNSLAAARGIADQIVKSRITNIAKLVASEEIAEHSDTVGLVFPVYFEDMPDIVKSFVEKLKLQPMAYVFGVATCGDGPGWALHTLDRLLKEKGSKLSAGFELTMPDNTVIVFNLIPSIDVQKSMLESSKKKMVQIAESVRRKEDVGIEGKKRLRDKLENILMKSIVTRIYRTPRRFAVTDRCVKCGICKSICPTDNIGITDGKVSWGDDCTQCLACLHWCPAHAINLGRGSPNPKRYHHPDITAEDMRLR